MRILLVEDEPHAAQLLAQDLREHAYAVDVAADDVEADEDEAAALMRIACRRLRPVG